LADGVDDPDLEDCLIALKELRRAGMHIISSQFTMNPEYLVQVNLDLTFTEQGPAFQALQKFILDGLGSN
jgi:hypothetical protein